MAHINVSSSGSIEFLGKKYKVALGKNGVTEYKKEGDEATPVGCMPIREIFYRSDKIQKPDTMLPINALHETDGWCDDPEDPNYNKLVRLPYKAGHEKLWRDDDLYDIIVILGYNDDPPKSGKGSAIFMHIVRDNYSPTAGCIALSLKDLIEILKKANKETHVCVNE